MTDIESILSRLHKVRRNARGWNACCPAHEDKSPSMLVWISAKGEPMFHCSTGCHWTAIKAAIGIDPRQRVKPPSHREPLPAPKPLDVRGIIKRWQENTQPQHWQQLADDLGVSAEAVMLLSAAWAGWHHCLGCKKPKQAWAFPMKDARRCECGIRLRFPECGHKQAVKGSRSGLFVPLVLSGEGPLMIVEGPTDAAAAIDLGFDVIGRPSCNDGDAMLVEFCRASQRDVVILANLDKPKERPDGSKLYPGQEGAMKLADQLVGVVKSVRIIYPLSGKDARQWKAAGATRQVVESVIRNSERWKKRNRRAA